MSCHLTLTREYREKSDCYKLAAWLLELLYPLQGRSDAHTWFTLNVA